MRKVWSVVGILVVVALVGSVFATAALAQGPMGRGGAPGYRQGTGVHDSFLDEDGDGVCDNFVDEDGDGVCDTCLGLGEWIDEDGDGVCDNFVDEDGDGVCDHHHGDGLWVDEDGDGINDNAPADGTGRQYGRADRATGGRRGGRP